MFFRRSYPLFLLSLFLLLCIIIVFSLGVGAVKLAPVDVVRVLLFKAGFITQPEDLPHSTITIIWDFRLARALIAIIVGAALAVAGAAFQGLFRNPLADPFVIGASSGAALGATLAIVLNLSFSFIGFGPIPFAAFLGALVAVGLVYMISQYGSKSPPAVALLLAGVALSSIFSSAVSFTMTVSSQDLHQIFFWLLGSISGRSWPELWSILPYIIVSFTCLGLATRPLDILAFGEQAAAGMGLSVGSARFFIVASASLATAAAVSVTGIIGFIGLLAPHMARLIIGPSHHRLLPAAALIGGILLVLADDCARVVLAPIELPVGILTSLLGGPFFLYLLKRRQTSLGGD